MVTPWLVSEETLNQTSLEKHVADLCPWCEQSMEVHGIRVAQT